MKNKQLLKIFILIIMVFCCSIERLKSSENHSELRYQNKMTQILPGEYLRSDFIEVLDKTFSPLNAYVYDTPQMIRVQKNERGILLILVYNFHEGGTGLILQKNGSVLTEWSGGYDMSNLKMEIINSENINLGFDRFKPMLYKLVGDAHRYVANKVLCGEYSDDKGQRYIFREDGWAIFPKEKFRYEIGLDHVEIPYDYFFNKTSNKIYAFKINKDVLEIFSTSGEGSEIVAEKPLLSLKKISKYLN